MGLSSCGWVRYTVVFLPFVFRMPSRRDFIKLTVAGGGLAALSSVGGIGCKEESTTKRPTRKPRAKRPRYYVQILLSGGHDTVYTTDPKRRAEVLPDIALPADNEIAELGKLRLGPHFAPLGRWAKSLSILNGVQLGTANHETGLKQFVRLKTNVSRRMPTALDIIGAHRDSQPLGAIYLNVMFRELHSPGYFGTADRFYFGNNTLLDLAATAETEHLEALAKALKRQAASLRRRGLSREGAATVDHLSQAAAFFDRIAEVPPFSATVHSNDYTSQAMSESLQRAVWLLEHDLTCGVVIDAGLLGWDTHINNDAIQTRMNTAFVEYFGAFLAELSRRKNAHGKLLDNTAMVIGSDMGRFPRLNDMLGKDHLPQTGVLFAGPWFHGGQNFGLTGKQMEALPISVTTGGAPKGTGHILMLDDVGATLLALADIDPQHYGYSGEVLEFLLADEARG